MTNRELDMMYGEIDVYGGRMNGTEWVGPGQGATLGDLLDEAAEQRMYTDELRAKSLAFAAVMGYEESAKYRTNLRLTGEPLTSEDIARIAEAK